MTTRLPWCLFPLVVILTACPPTSDEETTEFSAPPVVTEKPIDQALTLSVEAETRFCCDPDAPFPQTVGTITVTNTNSKAETAAINVSFNLDDGRTEIVDATERFVTLKSGESKTITIVANTCDFESETMLIEWGYEGAGLPQKQTLTVTNACPPTENPEAIMDALCANAAALIAAAFIEAVTGIPVRHSSTEVPDAIPSLPYTEVTGYGALVTFLASAKLLAAFSQTNPDVAFPPGDGPVGHTLYADSTTESPEGDHVVVYQTVDGDIPLDSPDRTMQFGFVFDSDDDTANNYFGLAPFTNDFFNNTDRWYEVRFQPGSGWTLDCIEANTFAKVPSAARVVIRGNAMMLVVPASEFAVANPLFRVTTFSHDGTWGLPAPHDWSGDPTPAVGDALARVP